ncbi:uncharacterized protein TNCV_2262201 [Trichonephila clavipes]|nr:uncharacterized protein TNCV_2262201 [Trichonephila clavipes]
MVWGVIAYNTRSPPVLIRDTMTAQRYVHDILQPHMLPLKQRLSQEPFFNKTMLGLTRQGCHKNVFALLLPFLGLPDSRSPIEHIWDNLGLQVGHLTSLSEI